MGKLVIGYDQLLFEHSNEPYKAVFTKIILQDKTIYRIDYTSQKDLETRRIELSRLNKTSSDQSKWDVFPTDTDEKLVQILLKPIETNSEILES
jgi:hypothetical protein